MQIPGLMLNIYHLGVLVLGESGSGKSDLALSLLDRGHQLIADDIVTCRRQADQVIVSCPPLLKNRLQIYGLGVLEVSELFTEKAVLDETALDLIIALSPKQHPKSLTQLAETTEILDLYFDQIILPLGMNNRHLALLIECAVKAYQQRKKGYNSAQNFIRAQQKLL